MHNFKLAALAAATAIAATAVFAAPADTVKTRIAGYRELGAAFKGVNDGLRGGMQLVLVQQSAKQIRSAAQQQYGWFPKGSGPQAGVKTAAKPAIWTQPAKFKAAQNAFANQAAALEKAAKSGKEAAIRAEAKKLGGTCKACHDQFRAEKE